MKRIAVICLLLALPLLLFGKTKKSYFYPEIRTDVRLAADGSARIIQERTYAFRGSYSWAFVELKKQGSDGITLNHLARQTESGWLEIKPEELIDRDDALYIRWNYTAHDEQLTFLLDYTVRGAVRRYQDVAEFYWKVIEDEHESVRQADIGISLPAPSPDRFKVFIHADALPGSLDFNAAGDRAQVSQKNLPPNAFLEVRVLADPGIFARVPLTDKPRYQELLAAEQRNFAQASLRKFLLAPLSVFLIVVLPLTFLFILYFRYGREPRSDYDVTYEHEPPRKAPPLLVPAILHQKLDKSMLAQEVFQGLLATLLDLARRRIVSVRETRDGRKTKYAFHLDQPDKLLALDTYSRRAAQFFFGQVARQENLVTADDIKEYGTRHRPVIEELVSDCLDDGLEWWQQQLGGELTDAASRRAYLFYSVGIWCSIIPGFLLLAGILTMFMGHGNPGPWVLSGMFAALAGVIFIFTGRSILRWSTPALTEHKRWKSFRRFLKDFSAIEQAPVQLLAIWEEYYVYATVLGVADKFLHNIGRLAEARGTTPVIPVWFAASAAHGPATAGMTSFADSMAGFQSFAANFSSMASAFSASTASGGGFSGGGGGGGGGGSSGAG